MRILLASAELLTAAVAVCHSRGGMDAGENSRLGRSAWYPSSAAFLDKTTGSRSYLPCNSSHALGLQSLLQSQTKQSTPEQRDQSKQQQDMQVFAAADTWLNNRGLQEVIIQWQYPDWATRKSLPWPF